MTQVRLKFTGEVRTFLGQGRMEYSFAGNNLGGLLDDFFAEHGGRELILDEAGQVRPYSRVAVNGRFSYLVGDMNAPVKDGDEVALIRPYVVAF